MTLIILFKILATLSIVNLLRNFGKYTGGIHYLLQWLVDSLTIIGALYGLVLIWF